MRAVVVHGAEGSVRVGTRPYGADIAYRRYMRRTTGPTRRTSRDAHPERFRMTAEDIASASGVPAVPPLPSR